MSRLVNQYLLGFQIVGIGLQKRRKLATETIADEDENVRVRAALAGGHTLATAMHYYGLSMRASNAAAGATTIRKKWDSMLSSEHATSQPSEGNFLLIMEKPSFLTFIMFR